MKLNGLYLGVPLRLPAPKTMLTKKTFSAYLAESDKIKWIMRLNLATLILILTLTQVSANSFSQGINIRQNNVSLKSVFKTIEKQSGYLFLSVDYDLDKIKVSINLKDLSIEDALHKILKDTNLSFKIMNRVIVLSTKEPDVQQKLKEQNIAIDISGRVVDESGAPLPGATVRIKNANSAMVTDGNGNFSFKNLESNAVIIISYTGFITKEVTVGRLSNFTITLEQDFANLNEVVVVGYGTQKKANLTGSVVTISSKDLTVRPTGQTSAALQGLAPGVTVTQRSGQPGADVGSIRIRGIGTLGDSNPLVLIDGVEGNLDNINPNDIETTSILKDAASASIYGSRAANGVILITTKRAKANLLSINYEAYAGKQTPTNLPKMTNAVDHMLLTNEAYTNTGRTPLYTEELINKYIIEGPANRDLYPETDWQNLILTGSGLQQSHFLNVSGGTEKVRSLVSAGYFDQKGIIENSSFNRFSLRTNTDITFSEKFNIKFDLQFINGLTTEPGRGASTVFHWMNRIPANQAGINTNGTWGEGWNGDNPIAFSREGGLKKNKNRTGSLNFSMNYSPVKSLKAEVTIAPVLFDNIEKNFNKVVQTYKPDGTLSSYLSPVRSTLTEATSRSVRNNMRATLTYDKDLGLHNFKILGGVSREDLHHDYVSAYREGFILPEYPVLDAGEQLNQKTSGNSAEWAIQSLFGRFNYNFKEKYLVEFNARYDGSSRFAEGNKYGFFPSVSAGWRISEEPFMQSFSSVITNLKIRGSWGQLGNQNIGNYPFVTAIQFGSTTLGNQIANSAALNTAANQDISWETTEMTNIGIDLNLFSNLSITAEYFNRETRDILYVLDIPAIVGLLPPPVNVGVVRNKGWELGLSYNNNIKEFKYGIDVNISDVKNKVIDLNGITRTSLLVSREGYAINSILGLEALGYFTDADDVANHAVQYGIIKPGDIKYKDQNNDGIINDADNIVIGSTLPRFTYGINLNASYKGFSISTLLQGVGKADGYLYAQGIMPFYSGGTVQEQHKDRWTPENTNSKFPRLAFSEANNEKNSSFWLKNAAYLRLKNIQLGYTLPGSFTKRAGINHLRIYMNGQNLFTKDNFWNGYDVESPVGTGNGYPQVKLYSFGLNANF